MTESFVPITFLAILQGVAEFLPISSSGHLVIAQKLLNVSTPGVRLEIGLHVGTLFSICIFYFSVLRRILLNKEWQYMVKIFISAIPATLVYFIFKTSIENANENVNLIGALLIVTGFMLICMRFLPQRGKEVGFLSAFFVGVAQTVALLPGISRSGVTIFCAKANGIDAKKSAEFSFLMSIPIILGALLLEIQKSCVSTIEVEEFSWWSIAYGAVLAAVVGYFALFFLIKAIKRFWLFGPYCIIAGVLTLFL